MDCAGALHESHVPGIASRLVMGKLPRLAGKGANVFPAPCGKAPHLEDRFAFTAVVMRYPPRNLKPAMPMPSGGISPDMAPVCVADVGKEIMNGSGGGIRALPMGPTAGTRPFRLAVEATMCGIPIHECARDRRELAVAMGLWGALQGDRRVARAGQHHRASLQALKTRAGLRRGGGDRVYQRRIVLRNRPIYVEAKPPTCGSSRLPPLPRGR